MGDAGSGWDDLFAAAAGEKGTDHTPALAPPPSSPDGGGDHSQRKQEEYLERVLGSRMDTDAAIEWPKWLRIGPPLLNTNSCRGWSSESADGVGGPEEEMCKNCGQSPLHHSLRVDLGKGKTNEVSTDSLELFALVRDIRCCGCIHASSFSRAGEKVAGKSDGGKAYARAALDNARTSLSLCRSLKSTVLPGEGAILEDKSIAILQAAERWHAKVKHPAKERYESFEEIVRLIVACDALYYRLYYLQITAATPILDCTVAELAFVPHPTTYFLARRLCWDTVAGDKCLKEFRQELFDGFSDTNALGSIFLQYGVEERDGLDLGSNKAGDISHQRKHPLSVLHYSRFTETVSLFWKSGWANSKTSEHQFILAVKGTMKKQSGNTPSDDQDEFCSKHETPAPAILMEWRDSSRDLLCNIYAYATLRPETVARIKGVLKESHSCKEIIELGAGTGYAARLLQDSGLKMTALDVAPTTTGESVMNEYHGCSPPFLSVQKGDASSLGKHLSTKTKAALLLCYPPPQSPMAIDALRLYTSCGGRCLVHIGEFQGLTGSLEFEKFVIRSFTCVERSWCLKWGTDAAEVTIWLRKDSPGSLMVTGQNTLPPVRLTIPCSNCSRKPAVKRSRLVRSLVYCSDRCYSQHENSRAIYFKLNMIGGFWSLNVDFNDERYFSNLQPIQDVSDSSVSCQHGEVAGNDVNANSHQASKREKKKRKRKNKHH